MGGIYFDTLEEYEEEIIYVRTQLRAGLKAEEFRLNTSQSNQVVIKDVDGIRKYLQSLLIDRQSFIEKSCGAGVTSLVYRRNI